jgi:hypothetical protein
MPFCLYDSWIDKKNYSRMVKHDVQPVTKQLLVVPSQTVFPLDGVSLWLDISIRTSST